MNRLLKDNLIYLAKKKIQENDPSHDINHALRVLSLSEKIAKAEGADLDIVITASILHDIICYPKNHRKRLDSQIESADFARELLRSIKSFPQIKIEKVYQSIRSCSFTKGVDHGFLEARVLHDADSLEAVGAIAIMRTFASAGSMNKTFYNPIDPFCKKREPDDYKYALDLFYTRLLIIRERLYTKTARLMAKKRINFLKEFLKELQFELTDDGI